MDENVFFIVCFFDSIQRTDLKRLMPRKPRKCPPCHEEALISSSLPQPLREDRTDLQWKMTLRVANPAKETL
jgi:hypothetical protein